MKKLVLYLVAFVLLSVNCLNAQSHQKGKSSLSVGLGFPNLYKTNLDFLFAGQPSEETPKESNIPPVSFIYEYGLSEDISLGVQYSFTQKKWAIESSSIGFRYSVFGVRGSYHLQKALKMSNDKFDPYVGVMLGYYTSKFFITLADLDPSEKSVYDDLAASAFAWQGYLGAKYHFTKNISAFGEIGYGFSIANVGVTYRF